MAKWLDGSRRNLEVGLCPGHIVVDGAQLPPKGYSPQFSAHVCCGQTAGWIKMPLVTMVGLGLGNIVLDADPAAPPRDTVPSQISAHVCCGQTAGWIKMPLNTKVGLGPGRILLHGDPAPFPKGAQPPRIFGACLLWPNGRPSQLLLSTCLQTDSFYCMYIFCHWLQCAKPNYPVRYLFWDVVRACLQMFSSSRGGS